MRVFVNFCGMFAGTLVPEIGLARLSLGTLDFKLCSMLEAALATAPASSSKTLGQSLLKEVMSIPFGSQFADGPYWNATKVSQMSNAMFDVLVQLNEK